MFSKEKKKSSRFSPVRRVIHTIIWGLNIACIILLCLCYISPFVSPAAVWVLALLGLTLPVLAILNLLFVFYWLLFGKLRFLYSLIALLLGVGHVVEYYQLPLSEEQKNQKGDFSLMSFNCRLFDLYNWTDNKKTANEIFTFFKQEKPDILCLQEFYHDQVNFRNIDSVKKIMQSPFSHVEYTVTLRRTDHWGIATFSKYPIVGKGRIDFHTKSNNICIYTDVVKDRDTMRIYNVHLQSIHFGKSDYKFVRDVLNNNETEEIKNSKNILRKLRQGFVKRSGQVDLIAEHISKCPYPVIVCGDFNDTPVSYTYRTLSENLTDAFQQAGEGFGRTYGGLFPIRIDYILHSPTLKSKVFKRYRKDFSDHFPIMAEINNK